MIKKFEDYTNGYGFLVPSESGSVEHITKAPVGDYNKVKSFKDFNGEYRKGSDEFGGIVNDLMMFLRMFKDDEQKDTLKFRIDDFQNRSNISIERIQQLLNSNTNLLSFDIKIDDKYITFKNLNNVYKSRFVWGESKNENIFSNSFNKIKKKNYDLTINTLNNVLDAIIYDNIKLEERIKYLYDFYFKGDNKDYNIRTGVKSVKSFFKKNEIYNKLKQVYNKLIILNDKNKNLINKIIVDINKE